MKDKNTPSIKDKAVDIYTAEEAIRSFLAMMLTVGYDKDSIEEAIKLIGATP